MSMTIILTATYTEICTYSIYTCEHVESISARTLEETKVM